MIHNNTRYKIQDTRYNFVFFGTDEHAATILDELKIAGLVPSLIVTAPDRPKGRGLQMTPPPVKRWHENQELRIKNQIEILQPEKLDAEFAKNLKSKILHLKSDLFIVARYGKILPKEILEIPKYGSLNVHPSLLPLFRGPSPAQSQILAGVPETGATIILLDEKVDHGPILAQEVMPMPASPRAGQGWPDPLPRAYELEDKLAHLGGKLLALTIPEWISGNIDPQEQDHEGATFTQKIKKEDGLIDLNDDPELNYRKFLAYSDWPTAYFFHNGKRIKITDAEYKNGTFIVRKVIPEGKKEMDYANFLRTP